MLSSFKTTISMDKQKVKPICSQDRIPTEPVHIGQICCTGRRSSDLASVTFQPEGNCWDLVCKLELVDMWMMDKYSIYITYVHDVCMCMECY